MQLHAIRHLPVLRDGKLVGLLSERDILEYRANLGMVEDWTRIGVSGVMTRSPQTADPDASVTEITARFATSKLDALPIVAGGHLVGIVTITDVLAAEVERAMQPMPRVTAADAMTPGPFTIRLDDNLFAAARQMTTHGIRHLPVVDDHEVVVGMLSERDLRTHLGDPSRFVISRDHTAMRVRDAVSHVPISVTADHPIVDVAKLFEDHRIGAVPVVDREGRLIGIVSYVDVLHALASKS